MDNWIYSSVVFAH